MLVGTASLLLLTGVDGEVEEEGTMTSVVDRFDEYSVENVVGVALVTSIVVTRLKVQSVQCAN